MTDPKAAIIGAAARTSAGHCAKAQKGYDRAAEAVRRIKNASEPLSSGSTSGADGA